MEILAHDEEKYDCHRVACDRKRVRRSICRDRRRDFLSAATDAHLSCLCSAGTLSSRAGRARHVVRSPTGNDFRLSSMFSLLPAPQAFCCTLDLYTAAASCL